MSATGRVCMHHCVPMSGLALATPTTHGEAWKVRVRQGVHLAINAQHADATHGPPHCLQPDISVLGEDLGCAERVVCDRGSEVLTGLELSISP